jgi:serine/threonine protein kinase
MSEEELFYLALKKGPGDRGTFLDAACAGDGALRNRVEALLQAHANPRSFWAGAAVEPPTDSLTAPGEPTAEFPAAFPSGGPIGPYKLLRLLGEGGMGEVWLAEQTEPVRRQVALKLIKTGMDSKQVLARFEAERQALALMDHPNIARVLDAGASTARPFFVMELVKGAPVTRFCDERRLGVKERVGLFVTVCQAVQHAHQKGVIHRDLKPSNVLVALDDDGPVPKVIDFGIAKATGQRLTEKTLFTGLGSVVGTPEYMSPEQAEFDQLDIDTRSDIYSLGVLLYELLTGTTPLDRERVRRLSVLEVLRLVREEEPPRPSTRLSAAAGSPARAESRGPEARQLSAAVRGDLDWIVMKCLEKDRNRRYETASALAEDLQRYLNDHPVLARPPSAGYRFRKFARRNRVALATAAALLSAVAAGIGLVWEQRQKALHERDNANAQKARAEANLRRARRVVDSYFTAVSDNVLLRQPELEPLRRQLLLDAVKFHREFVAEHQDDPQYRAELVATYFRIAILSYEIGPGEDWIAALEQGVEVMEEFRKQKPDLAAYGSLREGLRWINAGGKWHARDQDVAFRVFDRARRIWEELVAEYPEVPGFRNELATFHLALGAIHDARDHDYEAAVVGHARAAGLWRELIRTDPRPDYRIALTITASNLNLYLTVLGREAERGAAARESLATAAGLVAEYPGVPAYREMLAFVQEHHGSSDEHFGRAAEAVAWYRQMTDGLAALVREYPTVRRYKTGLVRGRRSFAELLWALGRRDEAGEVYRAAREMEAAISPDDYPMLDSTARSLAACPDPRYRDTTRAVAVATRAVAANPREPDYLATLGIAHYHAGDYRAAAGTFERALREGHRPDSDTGFYLAMTYWRLGEKAKAREWYDRGRGLVRKNQVHTAASQRVLRAAEAVLAGREPD